MEVSRASHLLFWYLQAARCGSSKFTLITVRSTHLTKRWTVEKSLLWTSIILTCQLSETCSASRTHSFCLFSLVLTIQMANIECFRAHSIHCMGTGHTGQQQGRLHNKGKVAVRVSCWVPLPHAQELIEWQLMVMWTTSGSNVFG